MEFEENRVITQDGESVLLYKTHGTCSKYIEVGVKEGLVTRCHIYGGCDGNTKGLSQLVVGMRTQDVLSRLEGIRCGMKSTSCPDQLCQALKQMQSGQEV
ncbi:MAG: TIGR03905 family TSCPD domain-containing protein [Bacteroidaceae bacterium]